MTCQAVAVERQRGLPVCHAEHCQVSLRCDRSAQRSMACQLVAGGGRAVLPCRQYPAQFRVYEVLMCSIEAIVRVT